MDVTTGFIARCSPYTDDTPTGSSFRLCRLKLSSTVVLRRPRPRSMQLATTFAQGVPTCNKACARRLAFLSPV